MTPISKHSLKILFLRASGTPAEPSSYPISHFLVPFVCPLPTSHHRNAHMAPLHDFSGCRYALSNLIQTAALKWHYMHIQQPQSLPELDTLRSNCLLDTPA